MKCKCGNDLFSGQFRCGKCGQIVALLPKETEKETEAKEKPKKANKTKKETK